MGGFSLGFLLFFEGRKEGISVGNGSFNGSSGSRESDR